MSKRPGAWKLQCPLPADRVAGRTLFSLTLIVRRAAAVGLAGLSRRQSRRGRWSAGLLPRHHSGLGPDLPRYRRLVDHHCQPHGVVDQPHAAAVVESVHAPAVRLYCLLLLTTVRASGEANELFVPTPGVLVAVVLALLQAGHAHRVHEHLARRIRASSMSAEVAGDTATAIPSSMPVPPRATDDVAPGGVLDPRVEPATRALTWCR